MCIRTLPALAGLALLAGCTSNYTASSGANGEDIYDEACRRCHTPAPETPDQLFALKVEQMNSDYIARRIRRGGMGMPRFPNIQGAELEALTGYVLANSRVQPD